MKIAVLGGHGNISAAVIDHLLADGHSVVTLTRGKTPRVAKAKSPLDSIVDVVGDRYDRASLERLVADHQPDGVVDMLCFSANDARLALDVLPPSVHYILISTVCVYGTEPETLPVPESHPLAAVTDYGRNKAEAEAVVAEAARLGRPITIVRPSTTFGPRQGLLRQVGEGFGWLERIRRGLPIIEASDGLALHQFMHVDDAGRAIAALATRGPADGRAWNLVGPVTTWHAFHRVAMDVVGVEVALVSRSYEELRAAEIPGFSLFEEIFRHHGFFDGTALYEALPEVAPQIPLRDAVARVYADLLDQGRIPSDADDSWEERLLQR